MTDNLPFEIQVEIMSRLNVKSLIRFRSVSKKWKSLIASSDFVARYSGKMQHLLVKYRNYRRYAHKYVLIVDDDTFPNHKVSPTLPPLVSMIGCCDIIGSSHGLLCLSYFQNRFSPNIAVLWNNSIRKAVAVVLPNLGYGEEYKTVLGFGVYSLTMDPKIVKIKYIERSSEMESISCISSQVEVFTLSIGVWRSPYSNLNLPRKSIQFDDMKSAVEVDGIIYWLATDRVTIAGGFRCCNLIISFDITSEEFKEVNLPHSLAHDRSLKNLYISKIRKSLVVLESDENEEVKYDPTFIVWMMEDGNIKSFAKLFTIDTPDATIIKVLEFSGSGEPILEVTDYLTDPDYDSALVVYEPCSNQISSLGLDGYDRTISACFYSETLLLLDQPDSIVYEEGKTYFLKEGDKTRRKALNI